MNTVAATSLMRRRLRRCSSCRELVTLTMILREPTKKLARIS
jgi:hypothetical protein